MTRFRQRPQGFYAVLAIGIVSAGVMNVMIQPQIAIAEPETNNGEKFAQLTAQVEQLSAALEDTQLALTEALAAVDALQNDLDTVEGKLQNMHVVGNDVIFEGVNVVVQSGSGATDGELNGTGNLIIGYDEGPLENKTGSHNLVVGPRHTYTNWGGFVAGNANRVTGGACSVSGGQFNSATGGACSVSGGANNLASEQTTSVSGGQQNVARNHYSSVSGGRQNEASGFDSSVSGGVGRVASGFSDWRAGSLFEDE